MSERQQRWNRHYQAAIAGYPSPALVLQQNQHLLPKRGEALDLACGLGANALLLAERGLRTHAWDNSDVALEKLSIEAERRQLRLETQQRDVIAAPPAAASFDVIVVSQFLDRALCPYITTALKPGGLLFYQTFCRLRRDNEGPKTAEFLLNDNELLDLFPTLSPRVYREEALLGDIEHGWRNRAMLVAEKVGQDK